MIRKLDCKLLCNVVNWKTPVIGTGSRTIELYWYLAGDNSRRNYTKHIKQNNDINSKLNSVSSIGSYKLKMDTWCMFSCGSSSDLFGKGLSSSES